MISLNIIGRVGKGGASIKSVRDRTVLAFSVAVNVGWGQNEQTLWFDCSLWGQRGEKLAEHINQGDQIGVTGSLSTREHEGKTYLKIDVQDVTLIGGKKQDGEQRGSGQRQTRSDSAREYRDRSEGGRTPPPADDFDDFDDSDLPF